MWRRSGAPRPTRRRRKRSPKAYCRSAFKPRSWCGRMASASCWWKGCIAWKRASNSARTRSSDTSCRSGNTSAGRGWCCARLRLAKLEHELIHRAGRTVDREIARVLGVAQEIALGDEPEAGRLDLAAQHRLFDAMERLSHRGAVAGPRRMVCDHQHAAGLERRVELAIHLGAI